MKVNLSLDSFQNRVRARLATSPARAERHA